MRYHFEFCLCLSDRQTDRKTDRRQVLLFKSSCAAEETAIVVCFRCFSIDLLFIVNQNLELETMAKHIIAAEPMLGLSHLDVVKDAM